MRDPDGMDGQARCGVGRHEARVAVVYGGLGAVPTAQDARPARAVASALKAAGMAAWITPLRRPVARLVRTFARRSPDVVVPLVPFEPGRPGTPALVASLLEWLEIPHVGSRPAALGVAEDDFYRGAALEAAGVGLGDLGEPIEVGVVQVGESPRVLGAVDDGAAAVALAAFETLGLCDLATLRLARDPSGGWGIAGASPLAEGVEAAVWVALVRQARGRGAGG
jgi:hypothetical protein